MPAFQKSRVGHASAVRGHTTSAPTCSRSKQTFLSFRVGRIRSLTPPPGPSGQRPEAPRAPHLIPISPQPGRSRRADPALPARPGAGGRGEGGCGQSVGVASWGSEMCGESGRASLPPLCNSTSQLCSHTAAVLPLSPRRAPGSLGFSNAFLGETVPRRWEPARPAHLQP